MYKIGDEVRIKSNLVKGQAYKSVIYMISDGEKDIRGKLVTITEFNESDKTYRCKEYSYFGHAMINHKKTIQQTEIYEIF